MYLITPLKNEDIRKLKAGDVVYLSGRVCTGRDKAHIRALSVGSFPADLSGGVIFHCGPLMKKSEGKWHAVSIGPTTSSRMDSMTPKFIDKFGVAAVIGKGGMGQNVVEAMKGKAVYLSMTGGCAASTAKQVKSVYGVEWLDLGMPEAVWMLEVEKMGPLVVAIDSHGRSLYEKVNKEADARLKERVSRL